MALRHSATIPSDGTNGKAILLYSEHQWPSSPSSLAEAGEKARGQESSVKSQEIKSQELKSQESKCQGVKASRRQDVKTHGILGSWAMSHGVMAHESWVMGQGSWAGSAPRVTHGSWLMASWPYGVSLCVTLRARALRSTCTSCGSGHCAPQTAGHGSSNYCPGRRSRDTN